MSTISRRKLITAGAGATAGALGLTAAIHAAKHNGLLPPDCGGVYGLGNTLTYASHRLLTGTSLAREFSPAEISRSPFAKVRPFKNATYDRLKEGRFLEWKVEVDGMVARPSALSLPELRTLPSRTQITQLACEEGWSFIAEWTGVLLSDVLKRVEVLPQARYLIYYSIQPNWWQSIDMADALHSQTLLVHTMNGAELPFGHGGPLRLRVPRQLGYKNVKYITRLTLADSLEQFKPRGNYSWYAGI